MHPIYTRASGGAMAETYEKEIHPDREFTSRELRFVYECLTDNADFRGPFTTTIAPSMLPVVTEAVRYFTNSAITVVGTDNLTGRLIIQAPGQR